jgi:transposase
LLFAIIIFFYRMERNKETWQMANQIKMANVQAILTLHQNNNWSNRRIARELGINRGTVDRYVRLARQGGEDDSKRAKAPPGSEGPVTPKPAKALTGSTDNLPVISKSSRGGRSACEPYRAIIEKKLSQGLTAQRIYQELVIERGFSHKYHSVRRYIQKLDKTSQLPFRRLECLAGEEAQVDFGTGAWVVTSDGKRRKTHVFRIVLSHSRKGYSEVVYRQTTEAFIRCLENAFWYFGGVTQTTVIDNLKAGVIKADWYDPELNPKLCSFAEHYGTVILPTKSYTPRHKGKIESGVNYVQSNALKGKTFSSLAEQNEYLLSWEQNIADTRIHGTTRKQVAKLFADNERDALHPLPSLRFPLFDEAQRSVHRDGHIEVAKSYYSVPPEYLGRRVWVRWDGRLVRMFNKSMRQIGVHAQVEPGRFRTDNAHIHSKKFSKVELGAERLLQRVGLIGPHAGRWGKAMMANRGVAGIRVLVGLESLAKSYSDKQIERACELALSYEVYRLKPIRELLKNEKAKPQESFEFMKEHEIIRDMQTYGEVVHRGIQEPLDKKGIEKNGTRNFDENVERTSAERAGKFVGHKIAGGCRASAEPRGVPGTYSTGRNSSSPRTYDQAACQAGDVPGTQDDRWFRFFVQPVDAAKSSI